MRTTRSCNRCKKEYLVPRYGRYYPGWCPTCYADPETHKFKKNFRGSARVLVAKKTAPPPKTAKCKNVDCTFIFLARRNKKYCPDHELYPH